MQLTVGEIKMILWMTDQPHNGVDGRMADTIVSVRDKLHAFIAPEPEPDSQTEDPEPSADEEPEATPEDSADPTNGTESPPADMPWIVPPEVVAEPVASEA